MLQTRRVPKTCRTLHPHPRRGSPSLCFALCLTNEARLASDFSGQKWIPGVVSGSSAMLRRGWICPRVPHTNAILPITQIIIRPISPPPPLSLSSVRTHTLACTHTHGLPVAGVPVTAISAGGLNFIPRCLQTGHKSPMRIHGRSHVETGQMGQHLLRWWSGSKPSTGGNA